MVVERRGVQPVPPGERHGTPFGQFTLWLGVNLTIADFALGFLPISLGLPWAAAAAAVVAGNALGAAALASAAAMGPACGLPQMVLTRGAFGRLGGRLPAGLNYLSTLGWYAVNTILGAFGLEILLPVTFWQAALVLVAAQAALGVYGHNLVHAFERVIAVVLGLMFAAMTGYVLTAGHALAAWRPAAPHLWPAFAVLVAAAISYVGSWSPYGADYSRYLPGGAPRRAVAGWAWLGAFLSSVWLELLGMAVGVLAGPHAPGVIAAAHRVIGAAAVAAIVLGAVAANAANVYSNSLSAAAVGIRAPRWALAVAASVIGFGASLASSGRFEQAYENFLLLLGYWFTAWLGVQVTDFYLLRHRPLADRPAGIPALAAFGIAIAAEVPFMSSTLWTGWIARSIGGADLAFYTGFTTAAVTYLILSCGGLTRRGRHRRACPPRGLPHPARGQSSRLPHAAAHGYGKALGCPAAIPAPAWRCLRAVAAGGQGGEEALVNLAHGLGRGPGFGHPPGHGLDGEAPAPQVGGHHARPAAREPGSGWPGWGGPWVAGGVPGAAAPR